MFSLQLPELRPELDKLHNIFGAKNLKSIYGAGCVKNPRVMFIFMNPTGRNISANASWNGLRAPWLGTKVIWYLFNELKLISNQSFIEIQKRNPEDWTPEFAYNLYHQLDKKRVYVTNLAKCTQADARHLSNSLFQRYLSTLLREIEIINPESIIAFGNQVSSVLLGKNISVSDYSDKKKELLIIGEKTYNVYPVYYPVGQGRRNIHKAISRVRLIIG